FDEQAGAQADVEAGEFVVLGQGAKFVVMVEGRGGGGHADAFVDLLAGKAGGFGAGGEEFGEFGVAVVGCHDGGDQELGFCGELAVGKNTALQIHVGVFQIFGRIGEYTQPVGAGIGAFEI